MNSTCPHTLKKPIEKIYNFPAKKLENKKTTLKINVFWFCYKLLKSFVFYKNITKIIDSPR